MSSYKAKNIEKEKPKNSEEVQSTDTPIIEDESYGDDTRDNELQTENIEETNWDSDNQPPMTGKMSGSMEELKRMQDSEVTTSDEVRECLKDSVECYQICVETTTRCLNMGGKHAGLEHINLLMDCARICNINADFMLRNSTYYPQTCGITGDICDECADTCDRFDDDFMKECASVCRRCAESCREMAR